MRRKSERNKSKAASPEKETERATRKSTRRRAKRAASESPDMEHPEEPAKPVPLKQETTVEASSSSSPSPSKSTPPTTTTNLTSKPTTTPPTITTIKEEETIVEESTTTTTQVTTANAATKASEEDEEDEDEEEEERRRCVWKVSREDASPGEIHKLKLSRQHNSASEGSSEGGGWSRRKQQKQAGGNKWRDSGVAEEADSESDKRTSAGSLTGEPSGKPNDDDPSSSYPGQDSNEEVSDSKEILPETTCSADLLSDDKPNIDERKEGEANRCCRAKLNSGGRARAGSLDVATAAAASAAAVVVVATTASAANKEDCCGATTSEEEEDNNGGKRCRDSSPDAAANEPRNSRRKHRSKYGGDSSNSETQESEEEEIAKVEEASEAKGTIEEERCGSNNEVEKRERVEEEIIDGEVEKESVCVSVTTKIVDEKEEEEEECEVEDGEKKQQDLEEKQEFLIGVIHSQSVVQSSVEQRSNCRPVKVNLKRSFSVRVQMEKIEEGDMNLATETSAANKENVDNGEQQQQQQDSKSVPRKRRWGTALSTDSAPSFSISTDSLKALVPGARPLSITEVRLSKDDDEDRYRVAEKWQNCSGEQQNDAKSGDEAPKNGAPAANKKTAESKLDNNHISARRKISIVKETAAHIKSPSPPATKPTNILLIKNLVRPFTLNQIKELLSRTGTIAENGFWMDRIKSKCFVEYANEDQAFETRQALHGISWPISNPKRLHVEYATKDDMELARELSKDQSIPRKTEPLVPSDSWQQDWNRDERANTKVMVVREWDLGKEDGQQHVKEKEKKEHEKKRRQRSRSPPAEAHLPAPARKFKKKEDEPPPAKLLDDLFRKTKATPCIYWLPLTNEQIVVKEEMRRQHMAEHARRLEEMRRAERNNRDGRRRRSPRK